MADWASYHLEDFLLFSPRTYFRIIESYNVAVWPWHVLALLSGMAILLLALRRDGAWQQHASASLLAGAWLWVAWAFHLQRYAPINWSAKWFAAAFAAQAVLLVATELIAGKGARGSGRGLRSASLLLTVFALVGIPLVQRFVGRPWSQIEIFGLFPDATAVASLGVILLRDRLDWHLFPLPVVACAVGSGTLAAMGSADAPIAIVAAVMAIAIGIWKTLTTRRPHPLEGSS